MSTSARSGPSFAWFLPAPGTRAKTTTTVRLTLTGAGLVPWMWVLLLQAVGSLTGKAGLRLDAGGTVGAGSLQLEALQE